jgi:hypothetical protein
MPTNPETKAMWTKSKIALSLAISLGMAPAAIAAPKHAVHRHPAVGARHVPGSPAYGYAAPYGYAPYGYAQYGYAAPYGYAGAYRESYPAGAFLWDPDFDGVR